ncbi:MAG: FHA domain-containing serine/threonine-protein kinase [Chthoniobacteraceae bacterium]
MPDYPPSSPRPLEAVFYHEDRQLARCLIRRGRYVIGHERKNEIVVDEPSVSGLHARLSVQSDDEIYIEDLDSANGTFVDGQPATGAMRLGFDTDVRIGAVTLRFERGWLPAALYYELPPTFLRAQRYDLGEIVVQGSTSTIYEARDTALQRDVALKMMLPTSQRDPTAVLRFVREVQITGQIPHPNILPVFDLELNEEGRLFFTTRFIEGESLASILDRLTAGDERAIDRYRFLALLNIWQKVCDAVAFAHSRGVVHNALTPEIIEVGRFGEVFVTQWSLALVQAEAFGDARHVRAPESTAPAPLSPYTAPEQAAGLLHEIDVRTDVFALGGLLYRIITLHAPLVGETHDALLESALNAGVPPPASVAKTSPAPHWPRGRFPEFPAAVAMKAMSYAREDRHASVQEMQREITAWQEGSTTGADLGALWKQFTGVLRQH